MSHVWQRERGMNVIARGLLSWAVSYHYKLDNRKLRQYPMEQQAQIIADYFLLKKFGCKNWFFSKNKSIMLSGELSEGLIRQCHEYTLKDFP